MRKKYAKMWVNPNFRDSLKLYAAKRKKKMVDITARDLGLDDDFGKTSCDSKRNKRFEFRL